jgi:hypothetical protein
MIVCVYSLLIVFSLHIYNFSISVVLSASSNSLAILLYGAEHFCAAVSHIRHSVSHAYSDVLFQLLVLLLYCPVGIGRSQSHALVMPLM